MERLLLLAGIGVTICLLVFASLSHVENAAQSELDALSTIIPDDPWYQEQVLDSSKPVLVEFTATWCGFCKQMEDVLHEIEKHYGQQVRVVPVDVDQHPKVAGALSIQGLPTVMLVKQGKIVAFAAGLMRYETVEKMILPHLQVVPGSPSPAVEDSRSTTHSTGTATPSQKPRAASLSAPVPGARRAAG